MKNVLLNILVGFLSGLIGAYSYFQIQKPNLYRTQQMDGVYKTANFSNSEIAKHPMKVLGKEALETDFVKASRESTPVVVYIKTLSEKTSRKTWLDLFFEYGGRSDYTVSTGSGVIYSEDGYIVTNNHVIQEADIIEVLIGKSSYEADIIGRDPSTDIAVLKIDAQNLPTIQMGSSRKLEVGEWVLAVGNPFNLTSTVTAGIVSAKGREINILRSKFPIESFIQTDAAINPGNSGGALVNKQGELVGINTAIISRTGSYAGYGFAVPIDIVKKVVNDIISYGEVQKAFWGADIIDIDPGIGKKLDLKDLSGVLVSYIQEGGTAESAGLERGDIIIKFDGRPINSRSQFEELLSYRSPGDKISITYKREDKVYETDIVLTNREGTTEIIRKEIYSAKKLGAELEIVSKVERDRLNIKTGIRITKIRGGLFQRLGIEEGFIITHINDVPIDDPETLIRLLDRIRGRVIVEGISRRGVRGYYSFVF